MLFRSDLVAFGEDMGDWLQEGLGITATGGAFLDTVVALVAPRVAEALSGGQMP